MDEVDESKVMTKQEEAAEKSKDMRCGPHKELGCLACWSNIILVSRYNNDAGQYGQFRNRKQREKDGLQIAR